MAKTAATKAALLNAYAARAGFASYCSADPSTTGANEIGAGRVAVPWTTATDSPASGGSPAVPCTPGTLHTHVAFWTAASGGAFVDGYALDASFTPATGVTTKTLSITQSQT